MLQRTIPRILTRHHTRSQNQTQRIIRYQTSSSTQSNLKYAKTRAGTGNIHEMDGAAGTASSMIPRGPVSWASLGLVAIAAASAVSYYQIERERRLENAMGKIVSSESGWSPNPEFFAKRKWKKTKYGWFPAEDAFGGGMLLVVSTLHFFLSPKRFFV